MADTGYTGVRVPLDMMERIERDKARREKRSGTRLRLSEVIRSLLETALTIEEANEKRGRK